MSPKPNLNRIWPLGLRPSHSSLPQGNFAKETLPALFKNVLSTVPMPIQTENNNLKKRKYEVKPESSEECNDCDIAKGNMRKLRTHKLIFHTKKWTEKEETKKCSFQSSQRY